jgi:probable lipoprotein NlpC
MIPAWVGRYIGVPFRDLGRDRTGFDCYGLVCDVYQEIFGVSLPSYTGHYGTHRDRLAVARVFFEEALSARWVRVPLTAATAPDVLTMFLAGERHVAILVTADRLLHVMRGRETCVERLQPHWAPRIEAVYHHRSLDRSPVPA